MPWFRARRGFEPRHLHQSQLDDKGHDTLANALRDYIL